MIFGRKNQNDKGSSDQEQEYNTAPGTGIRFDPELVDRLKDDHRALFGLYRDMKSAFESQDYRTVTDMLRKFRGALQEHLLTENVRLYIYLSHSFKHDDTNFELIRGFRKEMDGIAKTAIKFLDKYDAIGVDAELAASFGRDLAEIGEVLGTRIQKEESILYPLYTEQY